MKAITCPQCGALIKEVSERQAMTECTYCEAKVLIPRNNKYFLETDESEKRISPNENIKKSGTQTIWNSPFSDQSVYSETFDKNHKSKNNVAAVITVLCVGFFVLIVISAGVSSRKKAAQTRVFSTPYKYSTPIPSYTPFPVYSTPLPEEPEITFDLSYRVSWDSAISEQHIELPTLKDVDFPSDDLKTLKKTVFAQKIIRVRVRIDANGEVVQAKAISGHQLLKDAAENAARASFFTERKKPLNTVITYYFEIKQIE